MITITFGVLAVMLAATASLSGCFGLLIGCLIQVAGDKPGTKHKLAKRNGGIPNDKRED